MPKSQPVDVVIPCSAGTREVFHPYYHCKSSFNPGDVVTRRGLIELSVKSIYPRPRVGAHISLRSRSRYCARGNPVLFPLLRSVFSTSLFGGVARSEIFDTIR